MIPRNFRGALRPALALQLSLAVVGLAAISNPMFAQTAPAPSDVVVLEEFVATGTRFEGRTVTESPVPIDVLSARDLQTGGYSEVSQMLQALIPSFNFPRPTVADGTDHIRPATLRGLAPDQTLVLVNGKRRHTSSLVNVNASARGSVSVDFNAFPANIIERVEVLRDGASAQYGSDAIAGVINVILRKDHGSGFNILWGVTDEGDGSLLDVAAHAGMPLGEKGSLFLSVYHKDREDTNRSGLDTRQQYFGTNTSGALTAISGNYLSGTSAPPAGITFNPKEATINRRNHRHGDPESEEYGLFFNAEVPMSDGIEFYSFGGYTTRNGNASGFFRRPGDNRTVRSIYPDGFLPLINSDITDLSLGAGFTGRATSAWDWDASLVYGANSFDFTISNTANVTLGAASPRTLYAGELSFDQLTANIDLRRQFSRGDSNPVNLAMGAEFRWEGYNISPGVPDSYRDGGVRIIDGPSAGAQGAPGAQVFPGFRPSDAVNQDRNNYSLYVDAETDLTEAWLLSGAVRFEDYSDFGTETTAKVATRVKVTEGSAIRGSVSTGFRAPHLAQQWFSSTATNFIGGVPFENKTFPVTDPVAKLLGAKPLTPETSTNLSVGFTHQTANFSTSVDFYKISIDDRIVLSSNFSGGPIAAFLIANGQAQANGGRYFTNAVDTETKGVDVNARYTLRRDNSKWTFTAGINVNDTEVTRFAATPPQLAALGVTTPLFDLQELVRTETGSPANVINLGVNWETGKWTFNLRNIRFGEVENLASTVSGWTAAQIASLTPGWDVRFAAPIPGSPAGNQVVIQKFSAKWLTDLDVTYKLSDKVTVSVGANNLFDVYPDTNIPSNTSFLAGDNAGIFRYNTFSPFGFNGAFYYGKLAYKF